MQDTRTYCRNGPYLCSETSRVDVRILLVIQDKAVRMAYTAIVGKMTIPAYYRYQELRARYYLDFEHGRCSPYRAN